MAESNQHQESFMEKMADKLHFHTADKEEKLPEPQHQQQQPEKKVLEEVLPEKKKVVLERSSSSSSSSDEDEAQKIKEHSTAQSKVSRLFGREKPVHQVLGGGKPADVFLWRNTKISAGVLGTATAIWILFELLQYHLITLVCHVLILGLAVLFLWSNATTFINKSPPNFPVLSLPEQPFLQVAGALRFELNRAFALLHDIAIGKNLRKFLVVIAGLWFLAMVGKSCDFLTLVYINFVLLHTLPVLYEKHEDKVDEFAAMAFGEAKKHYAVVNERYISKIPRGPLAAKKSD